MYWRFKNEYLRGVYIENLRIIYIENLKIRCIENLRIVCIENLRDEYIEHLTIISNSSFDITKGNPGPTWLFL